MNLLCKVNADMVHCHGEVSVVEWTASDPFPELGPSVGVDTETELITDTVLAPPVVVLGVFDAQHMTCYIIHWQDVTVFMRELNSRDIQQRYFNLGFDEQVIDNEDPDKTLLTAIDQGRVRDMQIRIHLNEIATLGFIRHNLHSLAGCCEHYENWHLDKGDGTEDSARLSFRRGVPLTDEQIQYLPFDCISTWALGEAVREQPTEVTHTKGMCVLAHIGANGFPVDSVVYKALVRLLNEDKDRFRKELIGFGFPDPYRDDKHDAEMLRQLLVRELARFSHDIVRMPADSETIVPGKNTLRLILCYLYNYSDSADEVQTARDVVKFLVQEGRNSMRKAEKTLYAELCDTYDLVAFDESSKAIVFVALMAKTLEYINGHLDGAVPFTEAIAYATDYLDEHAYWFTTEPELGPRKFFQQHVRNLIIQNSDVRKDVLEAELKAYKEHLAKSGVEMTPALEMEFLMGHSKLKLEMTEKSGELKLTKQDMWRLSDLGISDKFLEAYTGYNHADKYLVTYLNPEYIKSDGRVHARFSNIKRTGRTSCIKPLTR